MTYNLFDQKEKQTTDIENRTAGLHPICGQALKAFTGQALTPSEYWQGLRTILRRAHNELICFYSELDAYRDDSEALAIRLKIEAAFLRFSSPSDCKAIEKLSRESRERAVSRINANRNADPAVPLDETELRSIVLETLDIVSELGRYLKKAKTRN